MATCDWDLCFIYQSNNDSTVTMTPSLSFKLKNNPDKRRDCYTEVTHNMHILSELEELPDCVVYNINGSSGVGSSSSSGGGDTVQQMMSNNVVWHKSCSTTIETLCLFCQEIVNRKELRKV